jgi:hypothetical protein
MQNIISGLEKIMLFAMTEDVWTWTSHITSIANAKTNL